MGKISKNTMMEGTSGMVGNVVFRQFKGETVVSGRPKKRTGERTRAQILQQRKMEPANAYAAQQMKDPILEKEYRAKIKNNLPTAYMVALADYLNAPVVHEIRTNGYTGIPGEVIKIKAIDDFKVVRVLIDITDSDGVLIEKGEAVRYFNRPKFWKYHITKPNSHLKGTSIRATAFDLPGNEGFLEVAL